ncbi:MAG: hypothetical protein MUE94_08105, partial [Verrucomicrobia bacterium]|nr:hypothetical protein [Verrucomicrobiota bacterium]
MNLGILSRREANLLILRGLPRCTLAAVGIVPVLLLALTAHSQTLPTRSEPWTVTERGPHHRVHERIEVLDLGGGRVERIPHRYVELASGLHYWEDKQWKASKAEFTLLP